MADNKEQSSTARKLEKELRQAQTTSAVELVDKKAQALERIQKLKK